MMTYEYSVESNGEISAAIAMAKNIFVTNGFKVEERGDSELTVLGPGMSSTKQNPILGLTRGQFNFSESSLEFKGELGGVEFMKKFLYYFPPSLGLVLCLFAFSNHFTRHNYIAVLIPFLCFGPWIFISPIMAKGIRAKTEQAIDTALHNITRV